MVGRVHVLLDRIQPQTAAPVVILVIPVTAGIPGITPLQEENRNEQNHMARYGLER